MMKLSKQFAEEHKSGVAANTEEMVWNQQEEIQWRRLSSATFWKEKSNRQE